MDSEDCDDNVYLVLFQFKLFVGELYSNLCLKIIIRVSHLSKTHKK